MEGEEPAILVAGDGAKGETRAGLPFGPFDPLAHRTFEIGLRAWVEAQTGLAVGYVEQLYTFGDRGRHARPGDTGAHVVSIGYLALTRMPENLAALRATGAGFEPWYRFLPWEDWRERRPDILDKVILPLLDEWALWVEIWVRALRDPQIAKEREALDRRWVQSLADIIRYGRQTG